MKGIIKVGKHTRNHGSNLKSLGYEVRATELFVEVEVSKLLTSVDLVDLQANPDRLKQIVQAKEGISYSTPIRFKSGQIATGIRACQGLEAIKRGLSCLVMSPADGAGRATSQEESPSSLKDFFGA